MFDGRDVAAALTEIGVTHVIWIPDSVLGRWNDALSNAPGFELIRVCREGEAFAMAAGLILGDRKPVIIIQCTGMFEAGDSLRNTIHDLGLPIFFVVGLRNYFTHREGKSRDTAPRFAEAILKTWEVPFEVLDNPAAIGNLKSAYRKAQKEKRPGAVFLAE